MVSQDVSQVPVASGTQLVGMLSQEDVMRFIEIRRRLGVKGAGERWLCTHLL
jgi:predicted transcriptional regulator